LPQRGGAEFRPVRVTIPGAGAWRRASEERSRLWKAFQVSPPLVPHPAKLGKPLFFRALDGRNFAPAIPMMKAAAACTAGPTDNSDPWSTSSNSKNLLKSVSRGNVNDFTGRYRARPYCNPEHLFKGRSLL
jgi:hypothetical protein